MITDNSQPAGALNRAAIGELIEADPPLIECFRDLAVQLQPNGFDLSLESVAAFDADLTHGAMGVADSDRVIAETRALHFDAGDWLRLATGPYLVTFNEIVNLPRGIMALCRPRSSLLRSGVAVHTAVWDAGYSGRSQALLNVYNPGGFRVQRNARIAQLVFFTLNAEDAVGYAGRYQHENL